MDTNNFPDRPTPKVVRASGSKRPSPNSASALGNIYEGPPQTFTSGPMYNITAGNMFSGVNYGSVIMIADSDDFVLNLRTRLKVSVKADHRYYASGDEKALRRSSCTPGTRVVIIEFIIRWATDMSPDSQFIYWLSGQAGAGKTTIACTICHQLDALAGQGSSRVVLGGSFFCSRQFSETRSASSIIRTIVYQLAIRSKTFRTALKEHGRFETVDHGPRSQFMGLLIEPWRMSAPGRLANDEPCYVIPIDALDELEGMGGTEFLGTLFDVLEKENISGLKFFVTSRSDPALVKRIISFPNKQFCRLEDVPLEESSTDIKLYLNENLSECATTQQIQQLVSDTAGLFIYAATVVEYVKGRDVEEQERLLKQLLASSHDPSYRRSRGATATLDNLYLQILEASLVDPRDSDDPDVFQDCLSILHTFLCTIERTSTTVAIDILNGGSNRKDTALDTGTANGVLRRLHAVLYSHGGQVMWFHKSFADFLFDKTRSRRFFCNQEQHHRRLANGCFGLMTEQLRFNIANISSSYQLDRDNSELPASIEANLSRSLRYSCASWSAHLILTSNQALDDLAEPLNEFLQLRILFWMESMNLLGRRGCCQGMLRDAQRRFSKFKGSAELIGKLADAAAFAVYHNTSKAALSTPHLYLSSLATFSRRCGIVQTWRRHIGGIPGFINAHGVGGEALVALIPVGHWIKALAVSPDGITAVVGSPVGLLRVLDLSTGEELMVLKGHTIRAIAVAFSPNGTQLVSGAYDESTRVWDLSTGKEVRILHGHTDSVNAVAYSPDGTHVVTGSTDRSVRVWDLCTGEEVRVFKGHSNSIRAVDYSPDGARVVSVSDDGSIRTWDLSTGEELRIVNGLTPGTNVVAYSPDGTHIVSGSSDKLVRVWDLPTGKELMVLKGHTRWVNAVAYSPDGSHVVSGGQDHSVRVWDLSTGEEVRVFESHSDAVLAVAYSPDGTQVISGSADKSIRIWDLLTEQEVRVHEGDIGRVESVAYSPDGTHVVSGSYDHSLRLFDLSTRGGVKVFKGHMDKVRAVAYSPNGTCVASGSNDKSIRVWDLLTGEETRVLNGHNRAVLTVSYSPDGTRLISGSEDKSIRMWDLATGERKVLNGNTGYVRAVAYSPDGNHIVSGSSDNSLRTWSLSTGENVEILKGHSGQVLSVAYSRDGTRAVSGSSDKSVRVWDLSAEEKSRMLVGHTDWVRAVAYSPDGTHIVSASDDKSIRVWDLSTGKEKSVLDGHTNGVQALAYSPYGTHVVSGSSDKSVRVWDVSPDYQPRYIRQKGSKGEYTGWLLSPTDLSSYLLFVPPAALLPDDRNVLTFPASSVPHIDFSNAKLGDRWARCCPPAWS